MTATPTTSAEPSTRPVRPDDADALLRMQHLHQRAVLGRPDTTLADVQEQLADPDLDPASPVVVRDDGTMLGCALVFPDGASGRADLDVVVDPGPGAAYARPLVDRGVQLAVAAARRLGRESIEVDQGCYRDDVVFAAVLRQAGFAVATTFHRMRRELAEPVDVTSALGVVVERVDDDGDEVMRRVHAMHMATFRGHFGFAPRPFEEWLAGQRARTVRNGPFWFATAGDRDVGFLSETDQFVEDEQAGYVQRVGVLDEARGRGIAKALLTASFAHMRGRGRAAALLHVDSANATGATALYESVGMTPSVVIDVWRVVARVES
ncbi:MAG: GNAT family N-acetyltransferase [Actinomycetes bacterium]